MADKIPVVVGKVKVTKSFDTTASKSVPELLAAALTAAINKSSKLKVVSSVKKGVKGFAVNLLVQEITCDLKKDKMGTKMQVELSMLPGPNMYAAVKGGGNISGLNAKKPAADVKDLMLAIFKGVGQNVRKGLEGRIGQF